MSTIKELHGRSIKSYASDPANTSVGQMWYNSTSKTLKGVVSTTAWSSGGNLPTAVKGNIGAGTVSAGLSYGGGNPGTSFLTTQTNEYNGTSWTNASAAFPSNIIYGGGTGTQTAALGGGGDSTANGLPQKYATYNGSSWTNIPTIPVGPDGAYTIKMAGTTTAVVASGIFGSTNTYEWNGSSWSNASAAIPSQNYQYSAVGTQTAASFVGGTVTPPYANTTIHAVYNGSSWTNATATPGPGAPAGTSSNGANNDNFWVSGMQGISPGAAATIAWDGSSWTAGATKATAINNGASGGTNSTDGFVAGGGLPTFSVNTEELGPVAVTKTFTTS
tara:strand:+ start:177 stop:1172 length:996 start_codon:yes stop_codon:yes gene_type:complete